MWPLVYCAVILVAVAVSSAFVTVTDVVKPRVRNYVLHAWVFPKMGIGVETFAGCVAIWVASWVLCLLVALIPGRFAKSMVE